MPHTYRHSRGTDLQIKIGAEYVSVAEVLSISGPGITVEVATVTPLIGPRRKLPGVKDNGQLTFEVALDLADDTHSALYDAINSPGYSDLKLIYPDTSKTWAFQAILSNFQPSAESSAELRGSFTADIDGEMTVS